MENKYKVKGLQCGNCAAKMEKAILKIPGVESARVSILTGRMIIASSVDFGPIEEEALKIMNGLEPGITFKRI